MNIYEMITNKILQRIDEAKESGKPLYWVRPWTGGARYALSYTSGKAYNGINQVFLDNGEYITYKALMDYKKQLPEEQAESVYIKKGCHKYPVFYFGYTEKVDKDGKPVGKMIDGEFVPDKIFFTKYYQAFSREDVEGLPSHFPAMKYEHTPTENTICLDEYIKAYARAENLLIDFVEDGGNCFYRPTEHMVRVPERQGFKSSYGYYGAVLHELVHSTSKGLHRELGSSFGSAKYSREELIAEIGSQMLLNELGIVGSEADFNNDVAYVDGWAKYLKESRKEIITASCLAEKAVKYFIEVAERQLMKERFEGMQEIAFRYDEGYLFVQEVAEGDYFDYTVFNQEMIAVDGGQIDRTEDLSNIGSAARHILEDFGIDIKNVIEYVDIEEFKELAESAKRTEKMAVHLAITDER